VSRTDDRTITERVNLVCEMVVAGLPGQAIVRLCRDKQGLNVTPRTITRSIAKGRVSVGEEAKVRRAAELGKAIARLDNLHAKSEARGEHRGALMDEAKCIELLGRAASSPGAIRRGASRSCAQAAGSS
jgi:hypothetical protein